MNVVVVFDPPRDGIVAGRPVCAEGTFELTAHEQKVCEAVVADDHDWLVRNPERPYRIRPHVPGECPSGMPWGETVGPAPDGHAWFTVAWLESGLVFRHFDCLPVPPPPDVAIDPIDLSQYCANSLCRKRLGADPVVVMTTSHVRRFCGVPCINEGHEAHVAALLREDAP